MIKILKIVVLQKNKTVMTFKLLLLKRFIY